MKKVLWGCEFCGKEVSDKGDGFRFFIQSDICKKIDKKICCGVRRRQVRICPKCLKSKNYETIEN